MKSVAVCYSEHAIKVSEAYCSGPSSSGVYSSSSASGLLAPSVCNAVTCLYSVRVATGDRFLVGFTWSEGIKPGFSVGICDYSFPFSDFCKNYRIRKARGAKMFEFDRWRFEVQWDLSRAEYISGPEPVALFYIVLLVNSERKLLLGDDGYELKKPIVDMGVSLVSKSEHFSGNSVYYSTRAKFCDTGTIHGIMIKCGDDGGAINQKCPSLSVFIDKKSVIQVKRLQWNFRGNQTIFIDGLVVDLMWDVHDLFFNPTGGYAVFLFRTRSGGSYARLWLDENDRNSDRPEMEETGFSLLITVSKNPNNQGF